MNTDQGLDEQVIKAREARDAAWAKVESILAKLNTLLSGAKS